MNFIPRPALTVFMQSYRVLLVVFAFMVCSHDNVYAQQVAAKATVDTNTIQIGGQFILSLELEQPGGLQIGFPVPADTFSLFEIVQRAPVDTVKGQGDKITRRQSYRITSFDSGYHVIPPFVFSYTLPGDTAVLQAETDPILITVQTIPVDTTRAIKDIKGNVVIPFSWQDAVPYVLTILIIALVAFLVFYLLRKFRKVKTVPVIQVPKRPAHEIALEALQQLEASKLWQQGRYKEYFTGLSDITRMFIENRWSVTAMEMTTEEILKMRIISEQQPEIFDQLKHLLELADLVKFAKVIPVLHENEQSMKQAVAFVKANQPRVEIKEVTA